ncbi:hypothetical protein DFH28DRAFT_922632 [Melampsora americana]|nr:hypothetical protein DFH28DRAFT_922632 [Melampsora americana]
MARKKKTDLDEEEEEAEDQQNLIGSSKPTSKLVTRPSKQPRSLISQRKKKISDESEPKSSPGDRKKVGKPARPASKTKTSKQVESMEMVKEVVKEEIESKEDNDEVLAREKLFAEIQEEYYDIVEELPLELDRTFTLIREMDLNVEESTEELHEDLYEYLQVAQTINHLSQVNHHELEGALAPLHPTTESRQLPAEFIYSLWSELALKIAKVQNLSRDKLDLAEKVYEGLDRHLRRIDAELDKYPDLEDQEQTEEKSDPTDRATHPTDLPALTQADQPILEPETSQAVTINGRVEGPVKSNKRKKSNKLMKNLRSLSTKSPRLSLLVSRPHFTEPPKTAPLMNAHSLDGPEPSSSDLLQDGLTKSDRTSPRLRTQSNLSPRKPSVIKLTGIFADPQPSVGPHRPESLSISPSMSNTRVPTPSQPTQASPTLFIPQTGREPKMIEIRRSSPVLRERRSVSGSIEKRKRRPSLSHRKRSEGGDEDSNEMKVRIEGDLMSLGEEEKTYCYCNKGSYGIMIACDNEKCDGGEWFHMECTNLLKEPGESDSWLCLKCEKDWNWIRSSDSNGNEKRRFNKKGVLKWNENLG